MQEECEQSPISQCDMCGKVIFTDHAEHWKTCEGLDKRIKMEKCNNVDHPAHYTFGRYEVIDVIEDWFSTEPHLFSAVQYLARWNKKGDPKENLRKAIWYINRKLQLMEDKKDV